MGLKTAPLRREKAQRERSNAETSGVFASQGFCLMHNLVSRRLLRIKHAAAYLGISCKAVRHLINSRQIEYVQLRPGNSPFLVDVHDLDRFIDYNKNHKGE